MTDRYPPIRRAAVLGAGVMGAQIAAHLTSAGIPTVLFDLPADEGERNGLVDRAIQRLSKLKPPPLPDPGVTDYLEAANFDDDLEKLADCDFILEAVAERLDIKKSLYERLAPNLKDNAIFASNTSGLSITQLAEALPESHRGHFCGVHFFNPPRYMHLVELIPHAGTDPAMLDHLEEVLTQRLGKGVVRAKDTPNFIGNRIGMFSMLSVMHHAGDLGLGFDTVDALTGPAVGRPKSATFRLLDVVGLDTTSHVIHTMQTQLEDDPWHAYFRSPDWLQKLIDAGALGQKTGAGVFRKEGKVIKVLDPDSGDYRESDYSLPDEVREMLAIRDPAKKLAALADSEHAEAQFVWRVHRDLFHYCAVYLADIADTAREIDLAMRWGYGWDVGPFESWQLAGWQDIAGRIKKDIDAGDAMADAALPEWVEKQSAVHTDKGSYSAARETFEPRPDLEVYKRQLQPVRLVGESVDEGTTVHETDAVRLWHLRDDVLILSFKTRMHVIDNDVIEGMSEAIDRAERDFRGLVLWHPQPPFSAGANLKGMAGAIEQGDFEPVDQLIAGFQAANVRLRQSSVPVVAALRGMALGGGLEVVMHCDRTVAHLESYVGLVEAGVGLLPAGGGLAPLARRIHEQTVAGDTYPLLEKRFKQVAMGNVSGSAMEAREMGYLRATDPIVMHEHELLNAAFEEVIAMDAAGYRPPLIGKAIPVAGDVGIATLKMLLANMHAGGFISDHDHAIGKALAEALCGGYVDPGCEVDDEWIWKLERKGFMQLVRTQETADRIQHMLDTGKPLRN